MTSRHDITAMSETPEGQEALERAERDLSLAIYRQTEGEWQPNIRQACELVQIVVAALAQMESNDG